MKNISIPFAKPSIDKEEINAVIEVMKSGWLTTGPKCLEFEEDFSKYTIKKITGELYIDNPDSIAKE